MKQVILTSSVLVAVLLATSYADTSSESELARFIADHVARVEPLATKANLAYWQAHTTGTSASFQNLKKLNLQIRKIYSSRDDFARINRIRSAKDIKDPRLARQLDKLYDAYLQNQIKPDLLKKIVELDTKIQQAYNNFRGTIDGRQVTTSDIYTILTTEKDCLKREKAWRASRQVGNAIVEDLLKLVRLRNEAARSLGFDNYHTFTIVTGEQNVEQLDRIFSELCEQTAEPFRTLKAEMDNLLADSYDISRDELMPWHYHDPFFQRSPLVYDVDLDRYYSERDVKKLAEQYYAGIGLPIDDILARSDLYDRQGKYPHAFSLDVDRNGDVRVLCNLQNTERWMETILHELGHAIYSKYHDRNEPWLLREPAHSFTTEAVAVFFGRLSRNADWMQQMLSNKGWPPDQRERIKQAADKYMRFQQILFARWALVMYHFEKALYADPDQDLNSLWWDLVEKYQFVKRPPGPVDAGWASKLHFVSAPCYYHNYMLGELLASQLHHHIVHNVLDLESDATASYVGDKQIGRYFQDKIFRPGARCHWNEMITIATGEPLTSKYFVSQFIE